MNESPQGMRGARLFGHPIHAMLIHFPSALLPVSVFFDILALIFNFNALANAAFYTLGAGVMGALIAAIFGAIDFYYLPPTDKAWKKAALHASLNILWIFWFAILFGLRINEFPEIQLLNPFEVVFAIVGIAGLIFSNYLGGELVFHYKIGVSKD